MDTFEHAAPCGRDWAAKGSRLLTLVYHKIVDFTIVVYRCRLGVVAEEACGKIANGCNWFQLLSRRV
jgi:hypothetical protein